MEKGSQKAVSSWWYFRADAPPDYSGYFYAAIAVGLGSWISVRPDPQAKERAFSMKAARLDVIGIGGWA